MAPRKMTAEQNLLCCSGRHLMTAASVLRDMFVKGTLTCEEKTADVLKENISTFKYFDTSKFLKLFTELKKEFGVPKKR